MSGTVTGRRAPILLLETATALSATGNAVTTVALPWLVLERTGSATAAGLVAAATAVPVLLSSLFSGTIVDLVGRRRVAMVSDALSAGALAAIPLVDAGGGLTVPVLIALAVLGAVFDPAGITAREAMLPAAAGAAGWRLERVNGFHEAVWGTAFLVGPGAGGVLIATVGAVGALWAAAGGFVASLVALAFLRLEGAGRPVTGTRPQGFARSTREGLAFVWRDPLLRSVGILSALLVGVYLPIEGLLLPAHFQAQQAPGRFGLLIAAMSAGGIVGALAHGAWGARLPRRATFVGALLGTAVLIVALALLPPFPVMVALGTLIGVCYGPVAPLVNLAMQTRTPEHLRGRVVGVLTSSEYAAGPLGYLLAGPLVEWLGVRGAFLVLAVAVLAVALAAVRVQSLRAFDQPPAVRSAAAAPDATAPDATAPAPGARP